MNLNQITLGATDIARSAAFYRALGLRQIVDSPHYARFECPEGEATFSIHQRDQVPADSGVVVYFECGRLDERVAQLQAAGIVFTQLPTDERWLWREARLRDPDGNALCLFHAGENRRNPPWRIDDGARAGR
jgi:catechol 2,3-dioxygenase-like lactoylglutathione lyase family enzyme